MKGRKKEYQNNVMTTSLIVAIKCLCIKIHEIRKQCLSTNPYQNQMK